MSEDTDAIVQATDDLIKLYRGVEQGTRDLPFLSFMPLLITFWSILKFEFFFFIGLFLIIPTNLVIFIRNLFPGQRWRYRPFFLRHLYYVWLWITRGEAPTTPGIFVRPLFNLFVKGHFESRLRQLRTEVFLRDGISDATRLALTARLDAALERWKTPRFTAVFFSAVLPGIIAIPGWSKQLTEFMASMGIGTEVVTNFVPRAASPGFLFLALVIIAYLIAIPVTAFLGKRGLFIGRTDGKVCFPGGQGGSGAYGQEKEILHRAGLQARELPIDLWLLGSGIVLSVLVLFLGWNGYLAWLQSLGMRPDDLASVTRFVVWENIVIYAIFLVMFGVATVRRRRLGRT